MTAGIYQITNAVTGKRYIGGSRSMYWTLVEYMSKLLHGRHHNAALQAAFTCDGPDAFVFTVLEEVSDLNELNARVDATIRTLQPEYNPVKPLPKYSAYQHDYYLRVTKPRREAERQRLKKSRPKGGRGHE